jgi:cytochrome b561
MANFLHNAAPMLAIVSFGLVIAGLIPSMRRIKAMRFVAIETFVATSVANGALAILERDLSATFVMAVWFVMASHAIVDTIWSARK